MSTAACTVAMMLGTGRQGLLKRRRVPRGLRLIIMATRFRIAGRKINTSLSAQYLEITGPAKR
jgi:hypothetical protein